MVEMVDTEDLKSSGESRAGSIPASGTSHQFFIDLGWYTVPLGGELIRDENGKKNIPKFPENYYERYTTNRCVKPVGLAAAICGSVSNIVVIDCDNKMAFDFFRALDPGYQFIFRSVGKEGGAIVYKYVEGIKAFRLSRMKLDFLTDKNIVYLPTEMNKTKKLWTNFDVDVKEMPDKVKYILEALSANRDVEQKTESHSIMRLGPLVKEFIDNDGIHVPLFKIITPKKFRQGEHFDAKKYLHPNEIPHGEGSDYLSRVSAILGADESVGPKEYWYTMLKINSMWSDPMDETRLNLTILDPMLEGKTKINGESVWKYNEEWKDKGLSIKTTNGDLVEAFFDDAKNLHYLVNYVVPYVHVFKNKNDIVSVIASLTGKQYKPVDYDKNKKIVRTISNPKYEFGFTSDGFNLFKRNRNLDIINNPDLYVEEMSHPEAMIHFFENLTGGDKDLFNYLLRFLRTKLTTFHYSPVVIYLVGVSGSGKDTFVEILNTIVGSEYTSKPEPKVFMEQYNGWIADKIFIQLDEYGDKLNSKQTKLEALGKIKAITGSERIQIRAMRQEGYNHKHLLTFIMTSNRNPIPIDMDDRRFLAIHTPYKLNTTNKVAHLGGISSYIRQLKSEIPSFCYYLATEFTNLSNDEYSEPPVGHFKRELIYNEMSPLNKIIEMIKNKSFDLLLQLSKEYDIEFFTDGWDQNKLSVEKLQALYLAMTNGNGQAEFVNKQIKRAGFSTIRTTVNGVQNEVIKLDGLSEIGQNDFTTLESTDIDLS